MSAIAIKVAPIGMLPGVDVSAGGDRDGRGEARPDGGRQRAGALRLTRAGRLAVTLSVLIALALAATVVLAGSGGASSPPGRVVTISSGQTLSELALTYLPDRSISAGVTAIQEANNLQNDRIIAGQQLVIPAR